MPLPAIYERIDPRRAAMGALLCWAGFIATAIAIAAGYTTGIEHALLVPHRAATRGAEAVRDVTALGGVPLRMLFALIAAGFLVALRQWRLAAWLAVTVLTGWAVGTLLKVVVARPRPDFVPHMMHASGFSFPSGHAFNGTLVWLAIALAFAPLIARRPFRIALLLCALALGAAIGMSRVWLGVHYPGDVFAGWLGGAGWAFAAAALIPLMAPAGARTVVRAG
ncbi:phosphatase PAP2 family protein [Erythrobacter sp. 3-20A1M]|uniref:phosphatase PAP2 family protein n=1 Tax=Erythrobacter sp. 3-20A1M TaxID=2653850 RepID=UPI0020407039|nr:phosphatase PAP2 family protein [Erythrobacter sp. 3-20A1M]